MTSCRMDITVSNTKMNTKEKEKYIEEYDFPFCDEATKYEKLTKIGQGTFGYVVFTQFKKKKVFIINPFFKNNYVLLLQ